MQRPPSLQGGPSDTGVADFEWRLGEVRGEAGSHCNRTGPDGTGGCEGPSLSSVVVEPGGPDVTLYVQACSTRCAECLRAKMPRMVQTSAGQTPVEVLSAQERRAIPEELNT